MEADVAHFLGTASHSSRSDARWHFRFGRISAWRDRAYAALNRINNHLKRLIEHVADAKMRRMVRELELHGIYYDHVTQDWMTDGHLPIHRGEA